MSVSSDTTAPDDVAPDAEMIAIYADVVFGYCDGWVPVRALAEKGAGDGPPHVPFIEADATLAAKLALQATWASGVGMALFVAPGTVVAPGDAKAESIAQTQVVLVDLDNGDIGAKRDHLVRHLGCPTLEVASGGVTAEGQRKLHLYWRLSEPAEGEDIGTVCRARHMIAAKVGGDPSFRSAHQPIRVAGSIHAKQGRRRLVEILHQIPATTIWANCSRRSSPCRRSKARTGSISTWPPPSAAASPSFSAVRSAKAASTAQHGSTRCRG